MSKSDYFENALLKLFFNGTAIANLADDAATSPLSVLYVSLHTADPGETGSQNTNECAYTSYARVAVARSSSGWTVTSSSVSPVNDINFPTCTGGTETATYFGIGTDSSGAGHLLYSGSINPSISIANTVPPVLTQATTITED